MERSVMTRFMQELSGALGPYWKKEAEKELAAIKIELEKGEITIDEHGVARNCIGRVLMADMLEKVALVTDRVNVEATKAAREVEVEASLREYRENWRYPDEERLAEMRTAFGANATVIDILSGKEVQL